MSIARAILLLACMAGADACLAQETAFPVQGQGADFLPGRDAPVGPWVAGVFAAGVNDALDQGDRTDHSASIGVPLDVGRLQSLRGGESSVDNDVLINGTVSDNVAEDVMTGSNAINGEAFANTSGISTVIQNTGNNVLIQNGMVVNVQFVGP